MGKINLEVGEQFSFSKTFTETDVTLFAGISADFYPLHVNEEFAKQTRFGKRIVHGLLTFSLASTTSGMALLKGGPYGASMKYDNLRFLAPVFFGDTITAVYTINQVDEEKHRTYATCEMTNQNGEKVLTVDHIMVYF